MPVIAMFALLAAFCAASIALARRWEAKAVLASPRHGLALASGVLAFFIVLAPLQEIDKTRADNTAGMGLVGFAAALLLVGMAWRLRAKKQPEPGAQGMY